jgi:hypothetical protein
MCKGVVLGVRGPAAERREEWKKEGGNEERER